MQNPTLWPKKPVVWNERGVGYVSIPFTWNLPGVANRLRQQSFFVDRWVVGGPAVKLMPDYLADIPGVTIEDRMPGVLQRVQPMATRTTVGCVRKCGFCGVRKIEPQFMELADWPDKPILCDNNVLAASDTHFAKVIERVRHWGWCDFNQGLDARLLTDFHAELLASVPKAIVRFALDNDDDREPWGTAVDRIRSVGVAKSRIRSYVLCGFAGDPDADWARCEFVESFGLKALPMWYHPLDALKHNAVTPDQKNMGYTKRKQRELMCWYYQHRTLGVRG